jgi:hypothetical protein
MIVGKPGINQIILMYSEKIREEALDEYQDDGKIFGNMNFININVKVFSQYMNIIGDELCICIIPFDKQNFHLPLTHLSSSFLLKEKSPNLFLLLLQE